MNEVVACGLGHLLEIPTPPIALVEVTEDFFGAPANAKLRTEFNPPISVGLHFGSQRVRDVYESPPATALAKCQNHSLMAGMVVFDVWTLNNDRKMDHCLIVRPDHHPTGFYVSSVDHGHCFGGPNWGPGIANAVGTWQPSCVPEMRQLIQGGHPFDAWLAKLAVVTDNQIDEILADIPGEWGLIPAERDALRAFIIGQKQQVGAILQLNRNLFPGWT